MDGLHGGVIDRNLAWFNLASDSACRDQRRMVFRLQRWQIAHRRRKSSRQAPSFCQISKGRRARDDRQPAGPKEARFAPLVDGPRVVVGFRPPAARLCPDGLLGYSEQALHMIAVAAKVGAI